MCILYCYMAALSERQWVVASALARFLSRSRSLQREVVFFRPKVTGLEYFFTKHFTFLMS